MAGQVELSNPVVDGLATPKCVATFSTEAKRPIASGGGTRPAASSRLRVRISSASRTVPAPKSPRISSSLAARSATATENVLPTSTTRALVRSCRELSTVGRGNAGGVEREGGREAREDAPTTRLAFLDKTGRLLPTGTPVEHGIGAVAQPAGASLALTCTSADIDNRQHPTPRPICSSTYSM